MVWAIAFIQAEWQLEWMAWAEFFEIVMSGFFNPIESRGADLIVGGFSLATDYMWVTNAIAMPFFYYFCFYFFQHQPSRY